MDNIMLGMSITIYILFVILILMIIIVFIRIIMLIIENIYLNVNLKKLFKYKTNINNKNK